MLRNYMSTRVETPGKCCLKERLGNAYSMSGQLKAWQKNITI